jgi:hypothetical protein
VAQPHKTHKAQRHHLLLQQMAAAVRLVGQAATVHLVQVRKTTLRAVLAFQVRAITAAQV